MSFSHTAQKEIFIALSDKLQFQDFFFQFLPYCWFSDQIIVCDIIIKIISIVETYDKFVRKNAMSERLVKESDT